MLLRTPKVSTFANFQREPTSSWQQKENIVERKPHDEYKILSEKKKKNDARIKQLELEMDKGKQTEIKYKELQQEYKKLQTENKELKAKVDELNNQLKLREEISKTARGRTSIMQDEFDSPTKRLERTLQDLIKSQENKLMNAIANGQQQSERKFAEATDKLNKAYDKMDTANNKLDKAYDKMDTATDNLNKTYDKMDTANNKLDKAYDKMDTANDKLETATARLNFVAEQICNRLDGHDGRKPTSKYSRPTNVSEMTLPPLNIFGKHVSDGLTRQKTLTDGLGVPHK